MAVVQIRGWQSESEWVVIWWVKKKEEEKESGCL